MIDIVMLWYNSCLVTCQDVSSPTLLFHVQGQETAPMPLPKNWTLNKKMKQREQKTNLNMNKLFILEIICLVMPWTFKLFWVHQNVYEQNFLGKHRPYYVRNAYTKWFEYILTPNNFWNFIKETMFFYFTMLYILSCHEENIF